MSQKPEKFEATSANITDEQKAKLKLLFPEIITEGGKIDFDRLKLTLGETVDAGKERYGMNWPGKADCFKTIQRPSMATLVPARDESVNFETTENLIIEGDNLETLKLLQKAYLGKVKMVFIDPPYNTNGDFIYPDDFTETLETYLRYTGQIDADGRKFSTNTETDGRFHSKWLCMMYPRLFLAKNLLCREGLIFITIDDVEQENLKRLCDEIFGEENFVSCVIWHKKRGKDNSAEFFSKMHDYVFCYAKDITALKFNRLPLDEETRKAYRNPTNDPRGDYRVLGLWSRGGQGGSRYAFTTKEGQAYSEREWLVGLEKMRAYDADNRLIPSGDKLYRKLFITENDGAIPDTIWTDASNNANAADELKALFGGEPPFDTPKPVPLIRKMLRLGTSAHDIVLDFFAGSGTTAHAVLEQNKEDNGNRKFVLVQLPELIEHKDFKTIADITKERVRRVIKQLNEADNNQLALEQDKKQDRGFKVFKLQSSNFKAWNAEQPKNDAELVKQLTLHVDHLVPGRTQDDVLYELLLKSGFPLETKVEKITLAGKNVFSIADGGMLICLEKELTPEVIKAMADKKPSRVVCLDASFADNDQLKTNAVQTMKSKGVTKFQTV